MAKIEQGRISGLYGMESHTAEELHQWADMYEAHANNPNAADDPKWSQRRAFKLGNILLLNLILKRDTRDEL